ncbi:MAG: hypothetical protein WD534_15205 [Phycisphaeraceae bacterium]
MPLPEYLTLMDELERLLTAVAGLVSHARQLFYELSLAGLACPSCNGPLVMVREGRCRCRQCGKHLDPTFQFQRCPACNGRLALRVCRYRCRRCGQDVPSRFLFDGKVFDADYFRQKMAASRQRRNTEKRTRREAAVLARSDALVLEPVRASAMPSLANVLDALVGSAEPDPVLLEQARQAFDLPRYEQHVMRHVSREPISLEQIPLPDPDRRLAKIGLFVALVFLQHAGQVALRQDGWTIWVRRT